jgi:hypothetical protein
MEVAWLSVRGCTSHPLRRIASFAAGGEEGLQQGGGFGSQNSWADFDLMVEAGAGENFETGAKSAAFGVVGAVNDSRNARLNDRSGAHGAWFERDIKSGASQAVIVKDLRHFADDHDFGVRGGVVVANGAIAGAYQQRAAMDHHCADGDFAGFGGGLRFGEGQLHEINVVRHAKARIA